MGFALISVLPVTALCAETMSKEPSQLQVRGGTVERSNGRATGVDNVGTAVQEGSAALQDKAIVLAAKAEMQNLWPQIKSVYPYLGDRGLLLEVNVAVNVASVSKPVPQKQLQEVSIVGVGIDPAHAWGENQRDALHADDRDYSPSPSDSWFVWITPGRRGWPKSTPDYKIVDGKGLLNRGEPRNSVVVEGVRVRGLLIANAGLREEARMSAIASVAKTAETTANNAKLREVAATLRKNAEVAVQKLAEINDHLKRDLEAVARAQNALLVLDGTIAIGGGATRISDALGLLETDAPKSPSKNMTEDEARSYISSYADSSKKSSIEYTERRTIIIRDVDGKVDAFKEDFKGSAIAIPDPK